MVVKTSNLWNQVGQFSFKSLKPTSHPNPLEGNINSVKQIHNAHNSLTKIASRINSKWKKISERLVLSYPNPIHNHKHFYAGGLKNWSFWIGYWLEDEHLVITRCFRKNHCHNSGKLIWIFKKHHNLSWSNHFFNTRWKNTNRNFWKLSANVSHTKHIILLQMVLLIT